MNKITENARADKQAMNLNIDVYGNTMSTCPMSLLHGTMQIEMSAYLHVRWQVVKQ